MGGMHVLRCTSAGFGVFELPEGGITPAIIARTRAGRGRHRSDPIRGVCIWLNYGRGVPSSLEYSAVRIYSLLSS